MQFPSELLYSKEHEWTTGKEGAVTVGITSYAVDQLGDIVHIELHKLTMSLNLEIPSEQ